MSHKEVTIYDIAKALNISPATVSRGLKDHPGIRKDTKKKIRDAAAKMGYQHNTFASNLRRQKTNTIGVSLHELNSNFMTSVLDGIERVTSEAGYDLIIVHSSERYEKEVANASILFHKRVDGLIASLAFDTKNLNHFKQFEEKSIPIIFFDRVDESSHHTKVVIDNHKGGYMATQHLIELGCKRIAMLTATLKRNVYAQRHKGYMDALSDNHIIYKKELVLVKDLSEQSGLEAAQEILKMKPMPDGLFVTNDFTAAVCMHALKEQGIRIPEDIAIVGFNNDAICKIVDPQLTTIDYPGQQMGELAATTLINQLKNPVSGQVNTVVLNHKLIVRGSTLRRKKHAQK